MINTGCLGDFEFYIYFAALDLLALDNAEELLVNGPTVGGITLGKAFQFNVIFIQSSHQTIFSGHKDKTIFLLNKMIKHFSYN